MAIQIDAIKKGATGEFIKSKIKEDATISISSSLFTIYSINEMKESLLKASKINFLFNEPTFIKRIKANEKEVKEFTLNMRTRERNVSEFDLEIGLKNNLDQEQIAEQCYNLVKSKFEVKSLNQSQIFNTKAVMIENKNDSNYVIQGNNLDFSMPGLGYTDIPRFDFIMAEDKPEFVAQYKHFYDMIWSNNEYVEDVKEELLAHIKNLYKENSPELIYYLTLYNLFNEKLMDQDDISKIKEKTGITESKVWNSLYNFQHDAVVGAIKKLELYNGCIIADSVGLGKTFEALAIIKYYELRNQRVLVLCPKKLRSNWTGFKENSTYNILADDQFRYDVLNHTDLSRDGGKTGDIDLAKLNWSNYDLVVIDESHAFRNNPARNDRKTRYQRLLDDVIKDRINTKVLMLSATPVNNRLADLKNQIMLITKGSDSALAKNVGIDSIETTLRLAQIQFAKWGKLPSQEQTTANLLPLLDYNFFNLLNTITIARSRKHIQKYYDTKDIGKFPTRLKPISVYNDIDLKGRFKPLNEINGNIVSLHLAMYSPISYVLATKRDEYEEMYKQSVQGGRSHFKQSDREANLVNLMRVNLFKRLESSVNSFKLTVERMLKQTNSYIEMLNSYNGTLESEDLDDIDDEDIDDVEIGNKIKVKIKDLDVIRMKADLIEDKENLEYLLNEASLVKVENDAKLNELKKRITAKITKPINSGNKKIIIFSAFADTAEYLYSNLSDWIQTEFGLYSGVITGSSLVKSNLKTVKNDFEDILVNFSPKSNQANPSKEIDILFATDCISEGQNLQDCDFLINYDIHWNPVRIIQRFGRVDRIGSKNDVIQLMNFWPNMELDEYIKLENRVRTRMGMVDFTSTGEDDLLNPGSKNLQYRQEQLKQLQSEVLDVEDLKGGISITDLTLDDFIMSLERYKNANPGLLEKYPTGVYSVTDINDKLKEDCSKGVIFCLKQKKIAENTANSNSLMPYHLIYVKDDGSILVKNTNPKMVLDLMKGLCSGKCEVIANLVNQFNKETRNGNDMTKYTDLLEKAVFDIKGIVEQKGIQSLFRLGQATILDNKVTGLNDFELITFLVVK